MNELKIIVWLFPVLFMIHDFEEIILVGEWKNKKEYNELKGKKRPFEDFISTASFSIAVAQEFILFSVVTLLSIVFNNYFIWLGFFFAFLFHFGMHCFMTIKIKSYTPGVVTSLIFLPIGIYLFFRAVQMIEYSWLLVCLSSLIGIVLIFGNLFFLHKMMPRFDKWVKSI